MRRKKLLSGLISKLITELENLVEVTIKERPFLSFYISDPKILDLSVERIEIKGRINVIIKEIEKV